MKQRSHTQLGVRVGDKVRLWDERNGVVDVRVAGITENHIVVVMSNGKLWCMAHKDFESLRALAVGRR